MYLWRAVDQDGDLIDVLVQKRKDKRAAKRFFRKMLKHQGATPNRIITDKFRSYGAEKKVRDAFSGSLSGSLCEQSSRSFA